MIPPIDTGVVQSELESVKALLDKWIRVCEGGFPGVDVPGSEENYTECIRGMCGELLLANGKIQAVLDVFSEHYG